jgi:BirA family biotin operon repressor/biotin-[acetyl-CoA-carboxylase] ligase
VTAAVALAAAEAVEAAAGFRPGLKWPNDLVVTTADGDRKLAGVLAEAALPAVVVGIGINLSWPPDLPEELAAIATAANHIAGRPVEREAVLTGLLAGLRRRYGRWDEVAAEHRACCVTIGRDVRVDLGAETFTGRATDVTEDGHLVVDPGTGPLRTVSAGDVIHLRPQ